MRVNSDMSMGEEEQEFTEDFFSVADEAHIRREKAKAAELRKSQWWKNRKGEGKCYYCRSKVHPNELTMDHVVPLSRGGLTKKTNVVTCCKECNNKKKYLLPVEWEAYLQGFQDKSDTE